MDADASQATAGSSEPVRRTEEIEDPTNLFFVHVIASRLTTVLARWHVAPNAVSIAGMACGLAAGVAYYHYRAIGWSIAGFALMVAWHVADGTDGQLARLTRRQSELGKVLDGICDYVTFAAVYLALAIQIARAHGGTAWLVVIASGLCHALQSAAYERQRQDYDSYGWGRDGGTPEPGAGSGRRTGGSRPAGLLHAAYERLQAIATGPGRDRQALDDLLRSEPARAAAIRRRYRARFAGPIRRWSVLSANTRTLGIFLCALAGVPIAYFGFEIVGFSLILAVLAARQRARVAVFLAEVRAAS